MTMITSIPAFLNGTNGALGLSYAATGNSILKEKSEFENLLNTVEKMEEKQIQTRENVYSLLTTGEGDVYEALIALNKAVSEIKTASVVRDKLIEGYQALMNMQI